MGSADSKYEEANKIDYSHWVQVSKTPSMVIMRNSNGLGEGQFYHIMLRQTDSLKQQMEIYHERRLSGTSLVRVYGAEIEQSQKTFICRQRSFMKVLTERIPLRFPQLSQLEFPEVIYLLTQSLRGYRLIYSRTGIFQVQRNMIGINCHGEVKVWANQNFAVNHPTGIAPIPETLDTQELFSRQQYRNIFAKATKNEPKMIHRICELIETKSKDRMYPPEFKTLIFQHSHSFDEILDTIENYCKAKNIFVPSKLTFNYEQYSEKRRSTVGPMKPFKNLRKNDSKIEKPVHVRRQNKYLHDQDFFLSPLGPGPQSVPYQAEKTPQTTDRFTSNSGSKVSYVKVWNNADHGKNTDRNDKHDRNHSNQSHLIAKTIKKQRGLSHPVQYTERIHSPSFLQGKNDKKSLSPMKDTFFEASMFKPKSPELTTNVNNKPSYLKMSPLRQTHPVDAHQNHDPKQMDRLRNTTHAQKVSEQYRGGRFFPSSNMNGHNEEQKQKKSLSMDIINLKMALHTKSKIPLFKNS